MKKRYFIWAAIFLFNPVVSVFDVFPDFIGYLLLMRAFSEASYVYDNAGETKEAFRQMALITLFKFISMIIVPFTDATMALVFSFSFSVIEVVLVLVLIKSFLTVFRLFVCVVARIDMSLQAKD